MALWAAVALNAEGHAHGNYQISWFHQKLVHRKPRSFTWHLALSRRHLIASIRRRHVVMISACTSRTLAKPPSASQTWSSARQSDSLKTSLRSSAAFLSFAITEALDAHRRLPTKDVSLPLPPRPTSSDLIIGLLPQIPLDREGGQSSLPSSYTGSSRTPRAMPRPRALTWTTSSLTTSRSTRQ